MTTLALILAMSSVPECEPTGHLHRAGVVLSAHLAYLVSGEPPVRWVALSGKESRCGRDATNPRSSAIGPWQVIAKNVPITQDAPLAGLLDWWPVNAIAAGVVGKRFKRRCHARWPACYNEGWAGQHEGNGDGFLATVRRMERQLRAGARHYGR